MSRIDILQNIKETEATMKTKIENAKKRNIEKIDSVKKQTNKIDDDYEKKAKLEIDVLNKTAMDGVIEERNKDIEKANTDAKNLKKNANVGKARDFFIQKFNEHIKH